MKRKTKRSKQIEPVDARTNQDLPPLPAYAYDYNLANQPDEDPDLSRFHLGLSRDSALIYPSSISSSRSNSYLLRDHAKERKRAARAFITFITLIFLLFASVIGGLIWLVFFSSVFALNLDKVTIQGDLDNLDTTYLTSVISAYDSTSLFTLNTENLEEQILLDPNFASVKLEKQFPSGLNLILERRYAAFAILRGDQYEYVAKDAIPILSNQDTPSDLLVLYPSSTDSSSFNYAKEIYYAYKVYEQIRSTELFSQITSFSVEYNSVTLNTSFGVTIVWGTSEDTELKLTLIRILLEKNPATFYDVSDPARVMTRS